MEKFPQKPFNKYRDYLKKEALKKGKTKKEAERIAQSRELHKMI